MTAGEVLAVLRAHDIRLTVDGDQLCYDAPAEAMTDEVRTLLRHHKPGLLTLLQQAPASATASAEPTAPPAHAAALTPLAVGWRCPWCHGTRRWRLVYGARLCTTCHPPADVELVATWEAEAR